MSAIPCGAWVSGISQSGLKNPAPDVNLPKSYNTRNQFASNRTRVRIPPAAPRREETPDGVSSFLFCCVPPLSQEGSCQQRRGVKERGGEDNERKIALHLVARRDKALDEQVASEIARGDQREMAEHLACLFSAAEEKCNTKRNKKGER